MIFRTTTQHKKKAQKRIPQRIVENNFPQLLRLVRNRLIENLLMVGPCTSARNVLGETDGERIVRENKVAIFRKNLSARAAKFFKTANDQLFRILFMRSSILSQ